MDDSLKSKLEDIVKGIPETEDTAKIKENLLNSINNSDINKNMLFLIVFLFLTRPHGFNSCIPRNVNMDEYCKDCPFKNEFINTYYAMKNAKALEEYNKNMKLAEIREKRKKAKENKK